MIISWLIHLLDEKGLWEGKGSYWKTLDIEGKKYLISVTSKNLIKLRLESKNRRLAVCVFRLPTEKLHSPPLVNFQRTGCYFERLVEGKNVGLTGFIGQLYWPTMSRKTNYWLNDPFWPKVRKSLTLFTSIVAMITHAPSLFWTGESKTALKIKIIMIYYYNKKNFKTPVSFLTAGCSHRRYFTLGKQSMA